MYRMPPQCVRDRRRLEGGFQQDDSFELLDEPPDASLHHREPIGAEHELGERKEAFGDDLDVHLDAELLELPAC